jgi:hypothetical protein
VASSVWCSASSSSISVDVGRSTLARLTSFYCVLLCINLCSQGPGTEVTSPEVYESIESEQYVFPAVKEDGILSSHTKFQMNCSIQQKVTAS